MNALLPSTPPIFPDLAICDSIYGTGLVPSDCELAGSMLVQGQSLVIYQLSGIDRGHPNTLPFSLAHGSCAISVEHAGPEHNSPSSIQILPNRIRRMAGHVISKCTVSRSGIGGFVTSGMESLIHLVTLTGRWDYPLNPTVGWFITVTISGPHGTLRKPGDTDPVIAEELSDAMWDTANEYPVTETTRRFRGYSAQMDVRSNQMVRGGTLTWWEVPLDSRPLDEMTYECDVKLLGSPLQVDCAQIQWRELGSASDTLHVGPGATKFITQNSCTLAISATIPLILTWAQLKTAYDTLINACVEHPLKSPQGGRAFFRSPPSSSIPNHKDGNRNEQLTGLNALPPHANLTVFAHTGSADGGCEWQAVLERRAVGECGK